MNAFNTSIINLCRTYVNDLQREGEVFLFRVSRYKSLSQVLEILYFILVKTKQCDRLEDLSEKEKADLWQEAKRLSVSEDKQDCIRMARALHGLGMLSQED